MTLKLRDGVSVADTDYGMALLDEDSGQYWNLNPTGALALRMLLDGGTTAQPATLLIVNTEESPQFALRAPGEAIVSD